MSTIRLFPSVVLIILGIAAYGRADEPIDARARWVNTSYKSVIEHVQGKKWVERSIQTQKVLATLTELKRTPEYIELSGFNFGTGRLMAKRAEMSKAGKWEWVSDGHWDGSASGASTTKEPASDDKRTCWTNTTYNATIQHVDGIQWEERLNDSGKLAAKLTEVKRTTEYIEFTGFNFGTGRLTATRMEMNKGGKWEWVSNGKWVDAPNPPLPRPTDVNPNKGPSPSAKSTPEVAAKAASPTAAELPRVTLRRLEVEPPASLRLLMQSAEQERAYGIAKCQDTIRQVLDKSHATAAVITSIVGATDGKHSIVAAAKAKGIRLDLQQLGTLQSAEQKLQELQTAVFVRPVLREFVPLRVGLIPSATVRRIDDIGNEALPTGRKRLLVELPDMTLIVIKSFPAELVLAGKALTNADADHPDTYYATTGYVDVELNGTKVSALVAEIVDIKDLDAYLKQLGNAREAAKNPLFRIWTTSDGKQSFSGIFETFSNNRVVIRKIDGSTEYRSMNDLSTSDQEFVRTEGRKRRQKGDSK